MTKIEKLLKDAKRFTDKKIKGYDLFYNKGYEQGKKDILNYLKNNLADKSNPCMKCGSIQCAICYDDIKKELMKE